VLVYLPCWCVEQVEHAMKYVRVDADAAAFGSGQDDDVVGASFDGFKKVER
jgi:hypothetical protein